jgi:replicative DNA helicase
MRELTQLSKALKQITENGNIFIDCGRSRTINWIAEAARSSHRKRKIGILVVDFIPAMDSNEPADGRVDHLAGSVRRLKTIALELQIPVIAVAQASRDVERRRSKRPRLSDLTESDAIESIADIVLFVHRPEYYDAEDEPGVAEIILAKNLDGPTGSIRLAFLKNLMRFENLAATRDPFDDDVPF